MARLGEVEIDVVETDQPTYPNDVSQKPVEKEADVSDHIKQQPVEIILSCIFAGQEAMEKHSQLKEMRDEEEVFEYEGSFGLYENMAIVEITPMKNAQFGNGFECQIRLKQVLIAELEETTIELGVDPETGEEIQSDTDETEVENRDSESEERDEETADQTTLGIMWNKIQGLGGEEE